MGNELSEVLVRYEEVKQKISNIKQEQLIQTRLKENYIKTLEGLDVRKEEIQENIDILEKSLKLFQKVSDERNKSAKEALETVVSRKEYLAFDENTLEGTLVRKPERNEFLTEIQENLIVEFYNR